MTFFMLLQRRVLVFPNGESITRAVYVWGETLGQLLENSAQRLGMRRAGKYIYDMNGQTVSVEKRLM